LRICAIAQIWQAPACFGNARDRAGGHPHGEAHRRPDLSERVERKSAAETRGVITDLAALSDQEADGVALPGLSGQTGLARSPSVENKEISPSSGLTPIL